MSDTGRKSVGDKIESAVKPDSQKGSGELLKDKVTDNVDNFVGDNTRSGDKSFLQQASDAVFGEKNFICKMFSMGCGRSQLSGNLVPDWMGSMFHVNAYAIETGIGSYRSQLLALFIKKVWVYKSFFLLFHKMVDFMASTKLTRKTQMLYKQENYPPFLVTRDFFVGQRYVDNTLMALFFSTTNLIGETSVK
ncbi:hypothetical protein JCM33374_g5225 [Metschnikowia sp. JCM 33374]|nr:hypothetical protein JCM33374_g5225 [Metschnikowia sp. JCM 33374]